MEKEYKKNHNVTVDDVDGQAMLAHKSTHDAKVAAEVAFEPRAIPSVA
jgi:pyruvate/2-oxoglutarate dehydrogenase complex dihydrolipoamide dehydrogenase (E3) component